MQLQSSQSTGPALSYSRKEILHQNIIQLISHPLLLVSLGFFSFTQVFRLCTLSERNPFVSLIQLLSTWGIHDPTIVEPLTSLSNTIQFSQLVLLIPSLAIAVCLWLISLNAKQMDIFGCTVLDLPLFKSCYLI